MIDGTGSRPGPAVGAGWYPAAVVGSWLQRILERLGAARPPAAETAAARRVDAVWDRRREHASAAALFGALRHAVEPGPLDAASIRRLAGHLRGGFGSDYAARGGHIDEHIGFWRGLADEHDHPAARAFLADCLLAADRPAEALAEFERAFAADPGLLHEFGEDLLPVARGLGGEPWLGYQLACLRAALTVTADGEDADAIREAYGELCEEHHDAPAALVRIREVGRLIDGAVDRGELPRALLRRGPR